jgi:hypothetical protein
MFSGKKTAAVSGLLCGLIMTGAGVTQAHAAADPGACSVDLQGNVTCVQRITGEMPAGDGGFAVRKSTTCVPVQPMKLPVIPLLNNGATRIGPEVTCNPDGSSAPKNNQNEDGFELPGGLLG